MSHAGHEHNATQDLLQAALVIARSSRIRGWLRANDPMALQQLDAALGTHQNTQPATQPVYLVINDTDTSGTGYVVRFASEEAYLEWQTHLDRLTGDAEEPFGFRGEWGIAHAILTPEQALALVPGQQAGTLTIPDGAWREHGERPHPGDPTTARAFPALRPAIGHPHDQRHAVLRRGLRARPRRAAGGHSAAGRDAGRRRPRPAPPGRSWRRAVPDHYYPRP